MELPEKIKELTKGIPYQIDTIGLSGSQIILYDAMVLKVEACNPDTASSVAMMQWLEGKIPVPKIICHEIYNGKSYLLTSKAQGRMACDEYHMERPEEMVALLADGLRMLWNIDISDCPRTQGLDEQLKEARYRVEHNLVRLDQAEADTFSENGFQNPRCLLNWLEENKPEPELTFSHGDFCLPNIFFQHGAVSGFIDLGDSGIADRWRDISLCWRSLKHNFDGTFGKKRPNFHPDILFEKLGVPCNQEKLRYYILLDELF